MKMTGKGIFLRILIPFWYRLMCCFSGKPDRVLFLEIRYGDVTDNLRLLKAAYEKEGGHKTAVYLLRTGEGSGFSFVLRCFGMLRALAKAKLVYVDESSDILAAVPVRRETAVIQCWHACGAFKRFGHGSGPLPREYYGPYAFVTVSSPDIVADYMDAMNQPAEKVLPLGVSRTDRFFDQAFLEAARKKVRALDPALSSRRILLYAPTFRGNVADAKMPPLPDFEKLKACADELGADFQLNMPEDYFPWYADCLPRIAYLPSHLHDDPERAEIPEGLRPDLSRGSREKSPGAAGGEARP